MDASLTDLALKARAELFTSARLDTRAQQSAADMLDKEASDSPVAVVIPGKEVARVKGNPTRARVPETLGPTGPFRDTRGLMGDGLMGTCNPEDRESGLSRGKSDAENLDIKVPDSVDNEVASDDGRSIPAAYDAINAVGEMPAAKCPNVGKCERSKAG